MKTTEAKKKLDLLLSNFNKKVFKKKGVCLPKIRVKFIGPDDCDAYFIEGTNRRKPVIELSKHFLIDNRFVMKDLYDAYSHEVAHYYLWYKYSKKIEDKDTLYNKWADHEDREFVSTNSTCSKIAKRIGGK
jgi:hypothetical protein